ncbi:SET domain-containing protein [Seiridium cupressi]
MAQTFESRTESFLKWFQSLPGATFHPHIQIQDLRESNRGRGIVATADIPEDTVLFTIPRDAIINTITSDLPKRIPQIFEASTTGLEDADNEADEDGDTTGPPDSWASLILVMIYEFLQDGNSRWKPYIDVLPTEFDTLMFWSDKELEELQASAIISKIGKDEADNMFRAKVIPTIQEHADVFYPASAQRLTEDQLMALAHRMGSTIMAYAFDLENDDEEPNPEEEDDEWMEDKDGKLMMGMVPMADILNADAEFNAHINHEEGSLTATSLRPIAAGEEVYNYYGPLSNGDLLRRYGYVTEKHMRYDVVELPWEIILSVLKEQLRLSENVWGKAINDLDEEEIEDVFVLDRDMDGPDSRGEPQGEKYFKQLPADLEEQIATFLRAVRKASPASIPDKRKRDEISLAAVHRALQLRRAQYPTTEAQDFQVVTESVERLNMALASQKSLTHPLRPDNIQDIIRSSHRRRLAAIVRVGEKNVLNEAMEFAEKKMSELNGSANAAEPSAKRKKTSR